MTNKKFTETVTYERPLPYPLNDLVQFVADLEEVGLLTRNPDFTDEKLVEAARRYWDCHHGED